MSTFLFTVPSYDNTVVILSFIWLFCFVSKFKAFWRQMLNANGRSNIISITSRRQTGVQKLWERTRTGQSYRHCRRMRKFSSNFGSKKFWIRSNLINGGRGALRIRRNEHRRALARVEFDSVGSYRRVTSIRLPCMRTVFSPVILTLCVCLRFQSIWIYFLEY